jgi:RIO kinase 2
MRYLGKEEFRVLTAVEMGMRNHEIVPVELISAIARLRSGGVSKILSTLLRHKLIAHANQQYDGYRLSYLGFDILALKTLLSRGVVASVGSQIGIGKESDIFEAQDSEGADLVIKIHRLGRTSFRAVRKQRDYMKGKSKASWLYMSRLAAIKEFAFMKALYEHGFPTPIPLDQNRHIVAMSRVSGFPMAQIKTGQMDGAEDVFSVCITILRRLAEHGLVHCDFNEFNLMVSTTGTVTMIDFPQMVSTSHPNAVDLFNRDVNGLVKFFAMKMRYIPPEVLIPKLDDIVSSGENLDEEVRACGKFTREDDEELIRFINFESDLQSAPRIPGAEESEGEEEEDDDLGEDHVEDTDEVTSVAVEAMEPLTIRADSRGADVDEDGDEEGLDGSEDGTRLELGGGVAAFPIEENAEDLILSSDDREDDSNGEVFDTRAIKDNIKRYNIISNL